MIKKMSLLVSACFSTAVIFAQTAPESNMPESPTKVFKYKLKLSPIKTKEEVEFLKVNKDKDALIECSEASYKPDVTLVEEKVNTILNTSETYFKLHEDESKFISPAAEKALLKALNIDSANLEIFQNETTNYSALYFGKDTLIGVKNVNDQTINYYYLRPGMQMKCTTESGEMIRLHSTQGVFAAGDYFFPIVELSSRVYKTKMMNMGFATTSLMADGVEVPNLIYLFQYPEIERLFPLQFNLFKFDNKYCFTLVESKVISNSKAINKRLKKISKLNELNRTSLNEFFQKVGFDY